jgi:putative toxin-antitoxin system antitoxin component (TIGR02293 family)
MADMSEDRVAAALLKQVSRTFRLVELRAAVRRGLPFSAFDALLKAVALPQRELALVLGIPDRTIARRREAKQLTAVESDRLYRVARTVAHTVSVLGTIEKARTWLTRPNRALGDEPPLALLDTDIGARQVEDVLLRIEYGIHS